METKREKLIAQRLGSKYLQRMSDDATERLASILTCKKVEKNQLLLKDGEICNQLYYVDKGLIRLFYYKYGRDMTEDFAIENDVCINAESYLLKKPTKFMIEAIEPAIIYCIPKDRLTSLMDSCSEINTLYRLMLESALVHSYQRIDSFRLEQASDRYKKFLKDSPEIVQRVPLLHIASYLLMSPETLSRVRSGNNKY